VNKIIIIAIFLFLMSCAASNIKELKEHYSKKIEFTVDNNYQRVYKNILDKMHECKGEGWAGVFASYHIQHELYNDLKEGYITFLMSNAGSQSYYMHIDVASISDEQTNVNAYVYYSTWEKNLPLVKQWAFYGNSGCDIGELHQVNKYKKKRHFKNYCIKFRDTLNADELAKCNEAEPYMREKYPSMF